MSQQTKNNFIMKRKALLTMSLLLIAIASLQAAVIDGIRVDSPQREVIVYVDGRQVSQPAHSCFVANLQGRVLVEVYDADTDRRGRNRGHLLHKEWINCRKGDVKAIRIGDKRPQPQRPPHPEPHGKAMSSGDFNKFFSLLKKQNFSSDRESIMNTALNSSFFTSDQCRRLMDCYDFEGEKVKFLKRIYPRITDKTNFVYAIDKLDFSSNKREVESFVNKYHAEYD